MKNKPFTHTEVIKLLDQAFKADISVKLNSESNIISYNLLTQAAYIYVMNHSLLHKNYDSVLSTCGLVLEVID